MGKKLARLPWRLFGLLGWLALTAGVVLQLWVRDRAPGLALLFYAMPKPCLAALSFMLFVRPRAGRWQRVAALSASVGISAWWCSASWMPVSPSPPAGSGAELKVLFWNLCRPRGIDEDMARMVAEFQPDVAAFVEPGPNAETLAAEYQSRLPGYTVEFIPRGILWMSRHPYKLRRRGKLEEIGAFAHFDVTVEGQTFPVTVADVYPHVLHPRRGQLWEALHQAGSDDKALLMGDFNTPAESIYFDAYRERYADALEAAGTGFRETWPLGLPLLSLDHIWAGRAWTAIAAEKRTHPTASDHSALLVRLRRG